jgi:hypothetical protein
MLASSAQSAVKLKLLSRTSVLPASFANLVLILQLLMGQQIKVWADRAQPEVTVR